jgi:hypothetical protein
MNTALLEAVLRRFGVDPQFYDLEGRAQDDAFVLRHEGDGWHVYFAERGIHRDEKVHQTEADACDDLLERISRDPLMRSAAFRVSSPDP